MQCCLFNDGVSLGVFTTTECIVYAVSSKLQPFFTQLDHETAIERSKVKPLALLLLLT